MSKKHSPLMSKKPDSGKGSVKEPAVAYAVKAGTKNKPVFFSPDSRAFQRRLSSIEKMNMVREGISKNDFERFKTRTMLDYDKLAKILSVTRATLINKKNDDKFNGPLSERIIDLAEIYSSGYEVFGDESQFNQWVFRSNKALSGQAPFDIMDNQFGRSEVKDIIGRISTGVYS